MAANKLSKIEKTTDITPVVLNPEQKTEMVVAKAATLAPNLSQQQIDEIVATIPDTFRSSHSLSIQLTKSIKAYLQRLVDAENQVNNELMLNIAEVQMTRSLTLKSNLDAVNSAVQQGNENLSNLIDQVNSWNF